MYNLRKRRELHTVNYDLVTFEIVKRLFTFIALKQRLACSRAKCTYQPGIYRATLRAFNNTVCQPLFIDSLTFRRSNAINQQFFLSIFAHPVSGPCRRKPGNDLYTLVPMFCHGQFYIHTDHIHCGTARISGCYGNFNSFVSQN